MPGDERGGLQAESLERTGAVPGDDDVRGREQSLEAPRPPTAPRSSSVERLPCPVSRCCHSGSGRRGGSIRSTSAPSRARVRVATGPAITLVRSSTRMPRSGASVGPRCAAGVDPSLRARDGDDRGARRSAHGAVSRARRGTHRPPAAVTASPAAPPSVRRASGARSARHPVRKAQTATQRRGVVRVVGVSAHPTVGAPEEPGQVGPYRGRFAVHSDVALARVRESDALRIDGLLRRTGELGGGEGSRRYTGPRQRGTRADGACGRVLTAWTGSDRRRGSSPPAARVPPGAAGPRQPDVAPARRLRRTSLTQRRGYPPNRVFPRNPATTRPGYERICHTRRNPRNLLLVRPTGKRRGRKALPPSSGEPPPF